MYLRPPKLLLPAAIALAWLAGCQEDHYEIEITPEAQTIQRKLTVYRQDIQTRQDGTKVTENVEFPAKELAAIEDVYERRLETEDPNVHSFLGTFGNRTPQDVGGSGFYVNFDTDMGSAGVYVERFRGSDDLFKQVQRSVKASERLVGILTGWFVTEIRPYGNLGRYGKLITFFTSQLRIDLKNFGLYCWAHALKETYTDKHDEDIPIRLLLYFAERGYFKPSEIPYYARGFPDLWAGQISDRWLSLFQKTVVSRAGLKDEQGLDEPLGFLATPQSLITSLRNYLKTTKEYRLMLTRWRRRPKDEREAEPPDALDVLKPLIDDLTVAHRANAARISVALNLPGEAVLTNASKAEDQTGPLRWSSKLGKRHQAKTAGLPPVCYAVWAVPDSEFQQEHFGQVVLAGQDLATYCLWREGLTEDEATEWDAMLQSLKPDQPLAERLGAFRFSYERPAKDAAEDAQAVQSHADQAVSSIIGQLKAQTGPAD